MALISSSIQQPMLFNSFNFLVFFPLFFLAWLATPLKYKWITLLAGSVFFYCFASVWLIIIPLIVCSIIYSASLRINRLEKNQGFVISTIVCLILTFLIYYKYNNIFPAVISETILLSLGVPIGISYFTFQAIGYLIDVKNQKIPAEKNFFKLFLYLIYFPKILAGPVERPDRFLTQLNSPGEYSLSKLTGGLKLVLVGLFKKIVIADRLSLIIDPVFSEPMANAGMPILLSSFIFPLQLYMDFSGYTDMARGFSKILGIDLIENFKKPFSSTTLTEFWRRWHISLSTWFNEYVFSPLVIATRNLNNLGLFLSLLITFTVIGIWHASTLGYLIYGALIGIIVFVETITKRKRKKISSKLKPGFLNVTGRVYLYLIITFLFLFIKTENFSGFTEVIKAISKIELISDTRLVVQHFINGVAFVKLNAFTYLGTLIKDYNTQVLIFAGIVLYIISLVKDNRHSLLTFIKNIQVVRHFGYFFILLLIMGFGLFHNTSEFLYFKF
jgi:D-alanyl-lipoteichoic acid acyltransferase DltB (MBOAT superfamily)